LIDQSVMKVIWILSIALLCAATAVAQFTLSNPVNGATSDTPLVVSMPLGSVGNISAQQFVVITFQPVILNTSMYNATYAGVLNPNVTLVFYPVSNSATGLSVSIDFANLVTSPPVTNASFPMLASVNPVSLATIPDGLWTVTVAVFDTAWRLSVPTQVFLRTHTEPILFTSPLPGQAKLGPTLVLSYEMPFALSAYSPLLYITNSSGVVSQLGLSAGMTGYLTQRIYLSNISGSVCYGAPCTFNTSLYPTTSLSPGNYSFIYSYADSLGHPAINQTIGSFYYSPSPPFDNITFVSPVANAVYSRNTGIPIMITITGETLASFTNPLQISIKNVNSSLSGYEYSTFIPWDMVSWNATLNAWTFSSVFPNNCWNTVDPVWGTCTIGSSYNPPGLISGTYTISAYVLSDYDIAYSGLVSSFTYGDPCPTCPATNSTCSACPSCPTTNSTCSLCPSCTTCPSCPVCSNSSNVTSCPPAASIVTCPSYCSDIVISGSLNGTNFTIVETTSTCDCGPSAWTTLPWQWQIVVLIVGTLLFTILSLWMFSRCHCGRKCIQGCFGWNEISDK
jgi:hypothetical protein